MRDIFFLSLFVFCAVLLTVACKNKKETIQSDLTNIPEGSWSAITMRGDTLNKSDFSRGLPSIIFKDSTSFSGTTGCNQYMASYTLIGNMVEIEMGPMTKMACPGKLESIYVETLNLTNKVEVVEDIMKFYNSETELLTFKKLK